MAARGRPVRPVRRTIADAVIELARIFELEDSDSIRAALGTGSSLQEATWLELASLGFDGAIFDRLQTLMMLEIPGSNALPRMSVTVEDGEAMTVQLAAGTSGRVKTARVRIVDDLQPPEAKPRRGAPGYAGVNGVLGELVALAKKRLRSGGRDHAERGVALMLMLRPMRHRTANVKYSQWPGFGLNDEMSGPEQLAALTEKIRKAAR